MLNLSLLCTTDATRRVRTDILPITDPNVVNSLIRAAGELDRIRYPVKHVLEDIMDSEQPLFGLSNKNATAALFSQIGYLYLPGNSRKQMFEVKINGITEGFFCVEH